MCQSANETLLVCEARGTRREGRKNLALAALTRQEDQLMAAGLLQRLQPVASLDLPNPRSSSLAWPARARRRLGEVPWVFGHRLFLASDVKLETREMSRVSTALQLRGFSRVIVPDRERRRSLEWSRWGRRGCTEVDRETWPRRRDRWCSDTDNKKISLKYASQTHLEGSTERLSCGLSVVETRSTEQQDVIAERGEVPVSVSVISYHICPAAAAAGWSMDGYLACMHE